MCNSEPSVSTSLLAQRKHAAIRLKYRILGADLEPADNAGQGEIILSFSRT